MNKMLEYQSCDASESIPTYQMETQAREEERKTQLNLLIYYFIELQAL